MHNFIKTFAIDLPSYVTTYIVQIKGNETVKKLRCVNGTLRRTEDCSVSYTDFFFKCVRAKIIIEFNSFLEGLEYLHLLQWPLPAAPGTSGQDCTRSL